MRIFFAVAALLLLLLALLGVVALFKRADRDELGQVFLSKFLLVVGVPGTVLGVILILGLLAKENDVVAMSACLAVSLLGASMIIGYYNCRIWYDEKGFTAENFLGVKRRYAYEDIRYYTDGHGGAKLYMNKRTVQIDRYAVGGDRFLAYAKKQYKLRKSHDLSRRVPGKNGASKSHLENAEELILLYILCLGLFVFVFADLIQGDIQKINKDPEGLEGRTICVEYYETVEEFVRLYEEDTIGYYRISNYEELLPDPEAFLAACQNQGRFQVLVEPGEGNNGLYYEVWSLRGEDGTEYYDFETYHKRDCAGLWIPYLIFGILAVLMLVAFPGLFIYVGRHPERFSKKFVRDVCGSYIRL